MPLPSPAQRTVRTVGVLLSKASRSHTHVHMDNRMQKPRAVAPPGRLGSEYVHNILPRLNIAMFE